MNTNIFDLSKLNTYKLIQDVVVHPLKVFRDPRGILVETLKNGWLDICSPAKPFSQNYFSETKSNTARDEDCWHFHPTKQLDRFVTIKGEIVVALYDNRQTSATKGLLNLFLMGESNDDKGYYNLLIPQNVLHCFLVVSKIPAIILNFPTTLFDTKEEGRISFSRVKISDGKIFSWNDIRSIFKLPLK